MLTSEAIMKQFTIVFIVFLFMSTVNAYAQISEFEITASDASTSSFFGKSVAISGDYAVVGAYIDDEQGTFAGKAYIFERNGSSWIENSILLPAEVTNGDEFGISVSISGDYAIVGARWDDDLGENSGTAYIFKRSDTTWTQHTQLLASDGAAGDLFGHSVSIYGDYILVGANGDSVNADGAGSAYIFKRNDTTWTEEAKIIASDGASYDSFGHSVSIFGDYALIGARSHDEFGNGAGAAYMFMRSGTTWTEQSELHASDGTLFDWFGHSVSLSADHAVIGAPGENENGGESGAAYVFKLTDSTWTEEVKLIASDGAFEDQFGTSVSISGDYILAGAFEDDDNGSNSGSAFLFNLSDTGWVEVEKFLASDGGVNDWMGESVSISGGYAFVGANGHSENGGGSGSAYIYSGYTQHDPFVASHINDIMLVEDFGSYFVALLDTVFDDPDLPNDSLRYSFTFSSELVTATVSGDSLWLFSVADLIGSAEVVVIATDDSSISVNDTFLVTIQQENDPPLLSDLPDVIFDEDESTVVYLSDWFAFVYDPDDADSTLDWLLNSGADDSVKFIIEGDSIVFYAPPNWYAFDRDTIRINVTDGFLMDSIGLAVHVLPVNDPPMFVEFPDSLTIVLGAADTLILSNYSSDIDDPDSLLVWSTFDCLDADSIACVTMNADTAFIQTIGEIAGFQELTFLVTDTSGASDTASVIIYIMAPVGIVDEGLIPLEYTLSNNYPNPFNPQTTISYGLPKQSNLSLIIYNLMGQEIIRWDEQNSPPGYHQKTWNGTNKFGVSVVSGVYFYKIIAGDFVLTKKMVLLK